MFPSLITGGDLDRGLGSRGHETLHMPAWGESQHSRLLSQVAANAGLRAAENSSDEIFRMTRAVARATSHEY